MLHDWRRLVTILGVAGLAAVATAPARAAQASPAVRVTDRKSVV